jgi:hypothetical protein
MSTRIRTTAELVAELEAEGPKFDAVFLAIGFDESATLIFANEPNKLAKLNRAVELGGEPAGLIAIQKEGNKVRVSSRDSLSIKASSGLGSSSKIWRIRAGEH